jgi:DnaJ-class molecular chaperone
MSTNLYALFGLTADAHPDVIKAAYRALAKQYHPDGAGAGNPEATAKFIELQTAYEILSNQDLRVEYDASLSQDPGEDIEVEPEASIDPDEIWKRYMNMRPLFQADENPTEAAVA